jgi:hypothetical protein
VEGYECFLGFKSIGKMYENTNSFKGCKQNKVNNLITLSKLEQDLK